MNEANPATAQAPQPPRGRARRKFFGGLAIGGLLGALAAGSLSVWSQGGPDGGRGHGCWGHKRMSALSAEERAARADFGTEWVLSRVDATEEQKTRIKAIVQATLADLSQVREQHVKHRDAFIVALQQPSVDRAALHELRLAELQLAESASERLVEAIAQAADVLTPEQRGRLAEMASRLRRW